jgi:hypothetical protein
MTRSNVLATGELSFRTSTQQLVRHVFLICFLALVVLTVHTLPLLQDVLDESCCTGTGIHDMHSTIISKAGDHFTPEGSSRSSTASTSCLMHLPMQVNASKVPLNQSTVMLTQPSAPCGRLRRSWNHFDLISPLAIQIQQHQSNCTMDTATFHVDNAFGLGSHLYMWSQALCNAWESGYRVQTHNPVWLWMDQAYCDPEKAARSPLLCYFPEAEFQCPQDESLQQRILSSSGSLSIQSIQPHNVTNPRQGHLRCERIRNDPTFLTEFRAASMEYLFRRISPIILQEAERQVGLLFDAASGGQVPADLITVHMRYGDKFWEMDLAPAEEYTAAVSHILLQRGQGHNRTANIYLATEDPRAVKAFLSAAEPGWKVYVDRTVPELDNYRPVKGNRASWTTKNTKGRAGLVALGSLLVALEANDFVLTTKSNWSRLMNELRKNILDPRCGNCTQMIDLRPGEW